MPRLGHFLLDETLRGLQLVGPTLEHRVSQLPTLAPTARNDEEVGSEDSLIFKGLSRIEVTSKGGGPAIVAQREQVKNSKPGCFYSGPM